MNLVSIPPGAATKPHLHKGYESIVYVLEGRVETRYGPGLGQSVITEAGDFLFIPPDVPAPGGQPEPDGGGPCHRGSQ